MATSTSPPQSPYKQPPPSASKEYGVLSEGAEGSSSQATPRLEVVHAVDGADIGWEDLGGESMRAYDEVTPSPTPAPEGTEGGKGKGKARERGMGGHLGVDTEEAMMEEYPPGIGDEEEREEKRVQDHLANWSRTEKARRASLRNSQVLVLPSSPLVGFSRLLRGNTTVRGVTPSPTSMSSDDHRSQPEDAPPTSVEMDTVTVTVTSSSQEPPPPSPLILSSRPSPPPLRILPPSPTPRPLSKFIEHLPPPSPTSLSNPHRISTLSSGLPSPNPFITTNPFASNETLLRPAYERTRGSYKSSKSYRTDEGEEWDSEWSEEGDAKVGVLEWLFCGCWRGRGEQEGRTNPNE